jgi:hypothetical protein
MGFFFMPTLLKAKNGLENHQKLAVWLLGAQPDEEDAPARATSRRTGLTHHAHGPFLWHRA